MSDALLSIRTDKKTKQEIAAFATELGISSTALVNMLVKQALRDKRIVLSTTLEPTPYLEAIITEVEEDYANDRNITHTHSRKEALAHLDSLISK
jgi:addiction module RelB/DinJ family antitoxin